MLITKIDLPVVQDKSFLNSIIIIDDFLNIQTIGEIASKCKKMPYVFAKYGFRSSGTEDSQFDHQWIHEIDQEFLQRPPIKDIADLVISSVVDYKLILFQAHVNCHHFGDQRNAHIDNVIGDGITSLYFANAHWPSEWQGEITFYQDGEPRYVVVPKPGRLVIFDGGVVHRGGVPAKRCEEMRYTIALKFKATRA
jgi:hypothetical protein